MRRSILPAVCILLIPALASAAVNVGDKPTLNVKGTGTADINLEQLRGKMVLVDFWATWCGPCMAEADHMVKIHKEYGPKGLQIVGISLDSSPNQMLSVSKRVGFDWPQHMDLRRVITAEWGVSGIPRTFLISPDGVVLWVGHPAQMDRPIEEAFKKHPPRLVSPQIVAQATQQLEAVEQSIESSDYRTALKQLSRIHPDARLDGAFAERAQEVVSKLEQAAQQMLDDATALIEQKQYADAAARLKDVATAMAATPMGKSAQQKLLELSRNADARSAIAQAEKNQKADDALAQARQLQEGGKDEAAYNAYKAVARAFAGTPAAQAAEQAVAQYDAKPGFAKKATESAANSKAPGMLSLAENYRKLGRTEQAKKKYEEVIEQFPDTPFAETAKRELASLN